MNYKNNESDKYVPLNRPFQKSRYLKETPNWSNFPSENRYNSYLSDRNNSIDRSSLWNERDSSYSHVCPSLLPNTSGFRPLFPSVIRYDKWHDKDSQSLDQSAEDFYSNKSLKDDINQNQIFSSNDNPPLGLPNTKSYCYMNSVIQALSHCIEFSNAVLSYRLDKDDPKAQCTEVDSILVSLFFQLMCDIGYRNKDSVRKSSIGFQDIHKQFPVFSEGEQDTDEYLQFLLNKLNDVTKTKNVKGIKNGEKLESFKIFLNNNDSFATRLFCGEMNNELRCFRCDFSKPSFQVFWVLLLPIITNDEDNTDITLDTCLESLLTTEKLDGKSCSKCHNVNCIYTRTEITHWPVYLIIHLKRHIQLGYSHKAHIKLKWDLNKIFIINENTKYSFLGVIDHIGSTISGHYVAKFRDLNDRDIWWCLNDMIVSKIVNPEEEIITSNTTTYFFAKKNSI